MNSSLDKPRVLGMTGTTQPTVGAGEVCRLTIYGPTSRIELAVPAHVPLADLLPTFLGHLGQELGNAGLDHGGWVLQRLGEAPLDEDLGTAALGLYDGDTLYLRPRNDQLPPADFDDLADGVATGISERKDAWRPELTRRLFLGLVGATLAFAVLMVPLLGDGGAVALVSGVAALVLLVGAAATSRALGDRSGSVVLSAGAIGFAFVAGSALPSIGRSLLDGPRVLSAPSILSAACCVAVFAVLGRLVVGRGPDSGFISAAVSAVLAAIASGLSLLEVIGAKGGAAIVLAVTLMLGMRVPVLAARMAGLRVLPLPETPEEFQQDIDPEPSRDVLERTARADAFVTALYIGLGIVGAGCLTVLAWSPGWAPVTLALVASVLLMLHCRELVSARQRIAVLMPGVVGAAMSLTAVCAEGNAVLRLVVVVALVAVAGLLYAGARILPGRKLLPYWGRAADWGQTTLAISIIPLVLAAMDLYSRVRSGWS
ncbi:type VII secretion integral membrane protein EccD [Saccharopolyspora erythraea NRRL 2338]|uniref:Integral membrane protein n=3 Tax=Saccharopolyspora erythraea TaxID=1836 RepID=A4FKY4_SACEN|nr:membrane protein [Saccharopolyspora erythraea D]PFG98349.1 type VII secretion integral membrane protein EccD [Saccharopolyspora erythraea NRRL 2338]QRK88423.1 type VII secretion integral membrane protein EccD [Saccharopolyspora erythraea]CAM04709.1 integral membrane protein [Saccharopolyspora erythraea NRRL 2338]